MPNNKKKEQLVFFVDKEQFKTDKTELTVLEILRDFAKEDPDETTLVKRKGNEMVKYSDLNQVIVLMNGMKFIVYHNGPTPVSGR